MDLRAHPLGMPLPAVDSAGFVAISCSYRLSFLRICSHVSILFESHQLGTNLSSVTKLTHSWLDPGKMRKSVVTWREMKASMRQRLVHSRMFHFRLRHHYWRGVAPKDWNGKGSRVCALFISNAGMNRESEKSY